MIEKRIINLSMILFCNLLFIVSIFSQEIRVTKRVMTKSEFSRLKTLVGVYEEGKNYNKIYDGQGTGLRPPTEDQWQKMENQQLLIDRIEIPDRPDGAPLSYDNSSSIWFPPIGTQDGEGSCVSWACGYYTKTFQEAREHNWDLSACLWEGGYYGYPSVAYQDKVFSPDFIYHQVNNGEDTGSYYSDNMDLLESIGCCTWNNMPNDPTDFTTWPNENAWRQAPWYRSQTGYGYMYVDTDPAIENLKDILAAENLAIISINADYYASMTPEDLWTLDNYNPSGTNHANTIVGYDDDYGPFTESGNPNTYGAFKVANSWGVGISSWENIEDGFYYISYECMKQRIQYIFLYQNEIDYEPEMIAVFEMNHNLRGENRIDLGIGNPAAPDNIKSFDDFNYNGGDFPYPANPIVFDITEFIPYMSGPPDQFFMQVYDAGTSTTGTIEFFSIEMYDDYASGVPTNVYSSTETPVNTQQTSTVYANVFTEDNTISLSPSNIDAPATEGDALFNVYVNSTGSDDWTAEVIDGDTWLQITSGASGNGNGEIWIHYDENSGETTRVGQIRVTATWATNSPQDATIQQVGTIEPDIEVTPMLFNFAIQQGETDSDNMTISNVGNEDLTFTINNSVSAPINYNLTDAIRITSVEDRKNPVNKVSPSINKGQYAHLTSLKDNLAGDVDVIFFDDMEGGVNGWTTEAYTGSDLWHQTLINYNSGTHSWWCGIEGQGNYDNGTRIDNAVISPVIDLGSYSAPITLEFFENYNTEPSYDFCMVDISNDGGNSWIALRGVWGSAPNGNSNGWILSNLDLSEYAGQQIQLRFYFDTGDGIAQAYSGWFIDDVRIYNASVAWLSESPTNGTILPSSNQIIDVTVDATSLPPGDYNAEIVILSNDPDESQIIVPVDLTVQELEGPPIVEDVSVYPSTVLPEGIVQISAKVWDVVSTVNSVQAEIESPDENIIVTLDLYDDGSHGDGLAGDSIYANSWTTLTNEVDYFVDIIASDDLGHSVTHDNITSFIVRSFDAPPIVLTPLDTTYQKTGFRDFINIIEWTDNPTSFNETYNIYMSSSPITNPESPGIKKIASNIYRGIERWEHLPFAKNSVQNSYYYAITATLEGGLETEIVDGVNNGGPLVQYTNPTLKAVFDPDFGSTFSLDGSLNEFKIAPYNMFTVLPMNVAGEESQVSSWDVNSLDINFEAIFIIDNDFLYLGAFITDDDQTGGNGGGQAWQGDAFEMWIGFYNVSDTSEWHSLNTVQQNGEDWRISFMSDGRTQDGANDYIFPDMEYSVIWEVSPSGYFVEAKIDISSLSSGYMPEIGDFLPFQIDVTDQDPVLGDTEKTLDCYITGAGVDEGWLRPSSWRNLEIIQKQHFTWTETEDFYPIVVNSVTLDGQPIDLNDEVGVFFRDDNSNLTCGGGIIWNNQALNAWDDDSQTPEKDGFVIGEALVYRLWDAGAQKEYKYYNASYSQGDGLWGTGTYAQVDLAFVSSVTLDIYLEQGWNWISSNVYPPAPAMEDVWSGFTDLEIVKSYSGFYIPGVINSIGDWSISQMYSTYLVNPSSLEITGDPGDPGLPIELQDGWNWVSFLPGTSIDAITALASVVDHLNIAKAYDGFYIPGVINAIGDMLPGKGYKINVSQACTLVYPEGAGAASSPLLAKTTIQSMDTCQYYRDFKPTEDYHAIVIQDINSIGGEIESGDELGIYNQNGLCIGGIVIKDDYPLAGMIWLDNKQTEIIDGAKPGGQLEMHLWKKETNLEYRAGLNILTGSEYIGESPFTEVSLEVDFKSGCISIPAAYALKQNYPNPFNPTTTVQYNIVEPGNVDLIIYGINGQIIKRLVNAYKDAGYHQVVWNGTNESGNKVSSGVYFYALRSGKFSAIKKMVLVK